MEVLDHTWTILFPFFKMTDLQINLVRLSWASLFPREEEFAQRCYEELFAREPRLRILFHSFMDEQHRDLSTMLSHALGRLHDRERLMTELQALGARHRGYGVKPEHHVPVQVAMETVLESMLGREFTAEVREAWKAFYALLQKGMALDQPPITAGA
jgi:hemoglobin-like flavoprotein